MRAYRLLEWQRSPELSELPVPEPGPGEVLVRVGGAGACHSDLHLMGFPPGILPLSLPFTLGHETAGWVEETGPGVKELYEGDAVAVYPAWGCGRCHRCLLGAENYCQVQRFGQGMGHDGGLAEFLLVPSSRYCIPLAGLDPLAAAPLTDAGLTPYHAVKSARDQLERPGSTALVIGVGGLGHVAVQILRTFVATQVLALDTESEKLDLARRLGADEAIRTGPDAMDAVKFVTGDKGVDAVFDFVGTEESLNFGASVLAPQGRLTLIGAGGGSVPFSFFGFPRAATLTSIAFGPIGDLVEVLELARQGRIAVETTAFPLARVSDAYQELSRGGIKGRAVIVPE